MEDKTYERTTRKPRKRLVERSSKNIPITKVGVQLPMDYPWQVLGWMSKDLAEFLDDDESALLAQIIRDRDVFALHLLSEQWGLQELSKSPVYQFSHISKQRALYQLSALLKKFRFDTDKDKRELMAIAKFRKAEAVCLTYNRCGYQALDRSETEQDACVLTYARSFLKKLLGVASPTREIVTAWSRHGPGANLDTCGGQSSVYEKYGNWPYSCSKGALRYARFLIETDQRWLGALEDSYRARFKIPRHAILDQRVFWSNVLKVVKGNRIAFVPKDARTERSIAIEPAINLMLQLGVDGHIRKRLKRWDVDLDSQTKNQRMARIGSIVDSDESFVTIDMSMASDTISLKLCEQLLPDAWYHYLCDICSPFGVFKKEVFEFSKISSMGNGFTFVLESAIFAALVSGAIKAAFGVCCYRTDMSIFGDDIIIKKKAAAVVIHTLNRAGFSLNVEKSFLNGNIRESCGTDWIRGKPVRPVFFDETPIDVMELFTDINRLKRVLHLRWGLEDTLTIKSMCKWIPENFRDITGPYSDIAFDSHLHVSAPSVEYVFGGWSHPRLVKSLVHKSGKSFLFRKIMHDLRGVPVVDPVYKTKLTTPGGNRFTVYKNYSYAVCKTYSATSKWSHDYAEVIPSKH